MKWIRDNIDEIHSLTPFLFYIETIETNISIQPPLCVEACKSLIEGICKTILKNKNINFRSDINFQGLVKQTIESILIPDEPYWSEIVELGRRTASVADQLGNIRNQASLISHGMDVLNPKLTETLSMFAYKITDAIGGFILSCYNNNREVIIDKRIHYEDRQDFNDYLDDLYPLEFGVSYSKALFIQDIEAYKESYLEYKNNLIPEI